MRVGTVNNELEIGEGKKFGGYMAKNVYENEVITQTVVTDNLLTGEPVKNFV